MFQDSVGLPQGMATPRLLRKMGPGQDDGVGHARQFEKDGLRPEDQQYEQGDVTEYFDINGGDAADEKVLG